MGLSICTAWVSEELRAWPRKPLQDWLHNAAAVWLNPDDLEERHDLNPHRFHADSLALTPRPPEATYLYSLRTAWFDYVAEELGWTSAVGRGVRLGGQLARLLQWDKQVLVGAYPVSTRIWTATELTNLPDHVAQLAQDYPHHYLGVRGMRADLHSLTFEALCAQGFAALPARVVYEFDARTQTLPRASHLQRDRALLKKGGLHVELVQNLQPEELQRVLALYNAVYLDKHSRFNPQYTLNFFRDVLQSGLMQCLVLKSAEGQIDAFALLYRVGDTLTAPAVGHDVHQPERGLYRQLFAALSLYVEAQQVLLNYSSGAGDFKRKRGGQARLEYTLLRAPQRPEGFKLRHHLLQWGAKQLKGLSAEALMQRGA